MELDERNSNHCSIRSRICGHCCSPTEVAITRTADDDIAIIPLTKAQVLEGVKMHIEAGYRAYEDKMDNGDTVYILTDCEVFGTRLYVKVKLISNKAGNQGMLIISAHPPRRWC